MTEAVVDRIKKLLRIGQVNSGATENEAAVAMQMASALMLKHGLEVNLDDDNKVEGAVQGEFTKYDNDWQLQCAAAVGYLYSSRYVYKSGAKWVAFVGRPDNIAAAQHTWSYLCAEVERLYKRNLPKGMSQEDRANFRRTFKFACARRLAARAWAIMEELRQDDVKAIAATGSRALVIVQSIDAQLAEADAMLKEAGTKIVKHKPRADGLGTTMGRQAGNEVQLQNQVAADDIATLSDGSKIIIVQEHGKYGWHFVGDRRPERIDHATRQAAIGAAEALTNSSRRLAHG